MTYVNEIFGHDVHKVLFAPESIQITLIFLMGTVFFWWGCCNRSFDAGKKFHNRSQDETGTGTVPADSATKATKTAGEDVQSIRNQSVPDNKSEKMIEATQAETAKLNHQSESKSKSIKKGKNLDQSKSQPENGMEEQDSFAKHIPKKRVARRSIEIKSRPPVRCDRDDYKTIPAHLLPSSADDI